jgi:hypothetical protein
LLAAPSHPGRHAHLSAASGLVRCESHLYVVADDEPSLAVFEVGREPLAGTLVALDETELPFDDDERKAAKPDLESLCLLPGDVLFTLGSGATERRERGWTIELESRRVREISLSELYAALRSELADLNVEGAAVARDRLWLAQRGNGKHGENAIVELDLRATLDGLRTRDMLPADAVLGIRSHELGEIEGVELSFSDLCPLPDGRLIFCAVAEAGESTYLDGKCVGAALGVLGADGVQTLEPLPESHKIEGVSVASATDQEAELLLVADGDDPTQAAPLLATSLAL